jgi:integrase
MTVQSAAPMGRKRTRDFDLPPRLYRRGARYYYVTHDRRWVPLGTDLAAAKRKWADFECLGSLGTVSSLIALYLDRHIGDLAPSTQKKYREFGRVIDREWGTTPADLLTPPQIAQWRDQSDVKPGWANGVLSLLRVAFAKAVEWGWAPSNPAAAVAFNIMPTRTRELTDDEFRAIWGKAPRWLRLAMDVCYLTAMRPGDVVALRWDAVSAVIRNRTRKTDVAQAFDPSAALATILEEARQRPILGLYVVATDKGRPITLRRLEKAWNVSCAAAGVVGAQLRDLRAKGATDAERDGWDLKDIQAMLGHATQAMTVRYLKGRRTVRAKTLQRAIR